MIRFENFASFSEISPKIHIRFTKNPNEMLLFIYIALKIVDSEELS